MRLSGSICHAQSCISRRRAAGTGGPPGRAGRRLGQASGYPAQATSVGAVASGEKSPGFRQREANELRGNRVLADFRGAQHAVEQQIEVVSHFLSTLSRPDVQRLGGTLRLL